ncbi:hypothetical protein CRYUN_Cryun03dG0039300 [Craigia yunnanensis]
MDSILEYGSSSIRVDQPIAHEQMSFNRSDNHDCPVDSLCCPLLLSSASVFANQVIKTSKFSNGRNQRSCSDDCASWYSSPLSSTSSTQIAVSLQRWLPATSTRRPQTPKKTRIVKTSAMTPTSSPTLLSRSSFTYTVTFARKMFTRFTRCTRSHSKSSRSQDDYETILLMYMHKTHAVDSDGKIISNADGDFYIVDDMIHVLESKPVKRYGDYFLRQIVKVRFIYTCLGVGIAVCLSTLFSYMVSNCISSSILCIYIFSICSLLFLEVAVIDTIFFKYDWSSVCSLNTHINLHGAFFSYLCLKIASHINQLNLNQHFQILQTFSTFSESGKSDFHWMKHLI